MDIPKAKILKVVKPKFQKEGVGAMVYRVLGTYEMKTFDPFLMLDFFYTKLPSGFPDHPHRGFQTLTYILQGEMLHEDFKGNKGVIQPGGIQWMIAGKGMVHAEIPGKDDEETIGFQLWINLPQKEKLCDPFYLDKPKDLIPIFKDDNYFARIISGKISGVSGAIKSYEYKTPIEYIDIHLNPQKKFQKTTQGEWNTFLFVYSGNVKVNDKLIEEKTGVFFESSKEGDLIECEAQNQVAKFLWISGQPINENVEWHGPFVMNEKKELQQALHDYHSGANGFEGAPKWQSKIKDKMNQQINNQFSINNVFRFLKKNQIKHIRTKRIFKRPQQLVENKINSQKIQYPVRNLQDQNYDKNAQKIDVSSFRKNKTTIGQYYQAWENLDVEKVVEEIDQKQIAQEKYFDYNKNVTLQVLLNPQIKKEEANKFYLEKKVNKALKLYLEVLQELIQCMKNENIEVQQAQELKICVIGNISQCYLDLKDFQNSIKYSLELLNLDDYNIKGLYRLSKAYQSTNKYRQALKTLQKGIQYSNETFQKDIFLKQIKNITKNRNNYKKQFLNDMLIQHLPEDNYNFVEIKEDILDDKQNKIPIKLQNHQKVENRNLKSILKQPAVRIAPTKSVADSYDYLNLKLIDIKVKYKTQKEKNQILYPLDDESKKVKFKINQFKLYNGSVKRSWKYCKNKRTNKSQRTENVKLQSIDANENSFSLGVKKQQDLQIFAREIEYNEMGFQAIPERIDQGTNTTYTIHKQKIVQTDMQIIERKLDQKQEQRLHKFLQEVFNVLEESLIENEVVKISEDDLDIGYEKGESRDNGTQLSIIKELKSFEFEKCNQKNVSCIQFLPRYNFMAVSLFENFTFKERVDISSRSFSSYILIWDYEEYHRFTPVAILESPLEFTSFQFKPDNPEYVVAGAVNGQVFLFDLRDLNLKKKFSDIVDNIKISKDNKEIKKFKPVLSSSIIESYSVTQKLIQTESITRKPLFLSSHKTGIKSLQFLPKNIILDKKNPVQLVELQEGQNLPQDQFVTLSGDGQILFWSLDLNDVKDKQVLPLEEFDFNKIQWKALLSIQLFDEFKNALQTSYLLTQQKNQNSFLYCADLNGFVHKIDFDIRKSMQENNQKVEVVKEIKKIETEQVVIKIDINSFILDFILVVTETCFYLYYKDIQTPIFVSTFLQDSKLTSGCFSTYRPSIVYIGKSDGILDVWDFIDSIGTPSQQHLVSAIGIDYIQIHQTKPNLLAVGDKASCIHLLNIPKSLYRQNQNELKNMQNWIENQQKKKTYYNSQFNELYLEEQNTQIKSQKNIEGLHINPKIDKNQDENKNFELLYE